MTDLVVGVDAGGTKVAIRAESVGGALVREVEVDQAGWEAEPASDAAAWLTATLDRMLPDDTRVVALGLGAQGCDNPEVAADLTRALAEHGLAATVVNDAALVVPAAGLETGIGVIAGTGAIAVGRDVEGRPLAAGGWGWVLGDDGGATGIVREATRAVLRAADRGEPDDGLAAALLDAFGVPTTERLARAVNDEPTPENWGPRAPAVFSAAERGSARALAVIEHAAAHLAELVAELTARGATGDTVVAAGSVIVRQPLLRERFRALTRDLPGVADVHVLGVAPVIGAVRLAREAHPFGSSTDFTNDGSRASISS